MDKIKVMSIFGTRPEAIKMGPLVLELKKYPEKIESIVVVTAQHREMLDQVLAIFEIIPDYDLDLMKMDQSLTNVTTDGLLGLEKILEMVKPDLVLVHGDTTTTFVASLAAFYQQVPVGHVEAGLRTGKKYAPYPEEVNRQLTGILADLHFAPTTSAANNLHKEGRKDHVYITGNTIVDALPFTMNVDCEHPILEKISQVRYILLTAHRRENLGEPLKRIFDAVKQILLQHPDLHVVYPVHPNPKVRELAYKEFGEHPRIHLIKPLDVSDFHYIISKATLILTDSGGIQEEAPSFGVPVVVLRQSTERPEGVEAGILRLVGTEVHAIVSEVNNLLSSKIANKQMVQVTNPYGDGLASYRIVEQILRYFDKLD